MEEPGMEEGEATSRVSPYPQQQQHTAGIIKRIRLENFMCHSNFEMEFGDTVNFILGQNGSGKSAILTALCVAFGCRAKGTQRANTLKDFIKSGCSNAVVHVEIQNEGEDAFKPETYGDVIIIERRISESTSSTTLKDHQGKKVVSRKADLQEIIEHFNIDVENPCVIMSQDKSREFLHSGNSKDKFKATLLQQVNDLLESISSEISRAHDIVEELEGAIRPIEKELNELEVKIKDMELVEQMSAEVQNLKKKLAWSWVYEVDKDLQKQSIKINTLKGRIPACQAKIDQYLQEVERLRESYSKKKDEIASMFEKASQLTKMTDDLKQSMSSATKEVLELEQDYKCKTSNIKKMLQQLKMLEQQVQDIHEQHAKHTQAEKSDLEEKLKGLQQEVHDAEEDWERLKEEEAMLRNNINRQHDEIKMLDNKIETHENRYRDFSKNIRDLEQNQINKISAFGGEKVMNLLCTIERYHRSFKMPPIGPIGAHLKLLNGDKWAVAVEHAIGRMLNSFIVTDHKDFLLLKKCAKEANYGRLQIIIYDFSTPRLTIPQHMVPDTAYPSTLSLLQSDNHTVINVLVDLGNVERQVLVKDYDTGKVVAFEQRVRNLKEIYTADGHKMFSRGPVQTVLPPNRRIKAGRLCSSYEHQIKKFQIEASDEQKAADECKRSKRQAEIKVEDLQRNLKSVKRCCETAGRSCSSKKRALEEAMQQLAAENSSIPSSSVEELNEEISEVQNKLKEEQVLLEGLQQRRHEASAKAHDLKVKFDKLCESANGDLTAYEAAETQLVKIERELESALKGKDHYGDVMKKQILLVKKAEEEYEELRKKREENAKKASIICCESELNSLGGCDRETPRQISGHLEKLNQTVQRESRRYSETIDDLRMLYKKKERKIIKRQQVYKALRQKLDACQRALDIRGSKFKRNATYLKHQLSWKFNGHLRRKGISGLIKVNYEEKTLSIEVQMPQDASNRAVRDTRGLSGGERSFSTLCFALALHEMTEAPFRAMDEFDVFMDAVSRKISLDTLIDFAVGQGSQWLFITPHDTSMVKPGPKVRKLQMPAPRS